MQDELVRKVTHIYVAALAFGTSARWASQASQCRKGWGFFTCGLLTEHYFSFGVLLLGLGYFLSQAFGEPFNCVRRRHV